MSFAHIPHLQTANIYIPVNKAKLEYYFQEVRKIMAPAGQRVVVHCLQTYKDTRVARTPDNLAVATEAELRDCYLTFVDGNDQVLQELPIQNLLAEEYNGVRYEVRYDNVDFTRSYIAFSRDTNLVAAPATRIVVISVWYTFENIA